MTAGTRPTPAPPWQTEFLDRHQLEPAFLATALRWFTPLVHTLAAHQKSANRPILVALNGCQGSGKTTVSDYLCTTLAAEHKLQAIALSLDDFYLTRAQRQTLATTVHPLLLTRGVPGTHDQALMHATLEQLLDAQRTAPVAIPRFDKAMDDRRPPANWDSITPPVQVIVLEGWCLGAQRQSPATLSTPLNDLERNEDPLAAWRKYSDAAVERDFLSLYALVDQWIMLRAPSFDCVFAWRREQERKLAATLPPDCDNQLMDDNALRRFIQHYERYTRHCLDTLPDRVDHLYTLDEQRRITNYFQRPQTDLSP